VITYLKVTKYYILYVLPLLKFFSKTKGLKNSHKNYYAFVFANGPSLKKIDPYKVANLQKKNYYVFGVNSFISSNFASIVIPNYYVLSDPAYFGIESKLLTEERKVEVKRDFNKLLQNKVKLFIPSRFIRKNNYDFISAFNDSQNIFSNNITNPLRPRGYLSMTAYKALAMACYMGFKKIYICGFDNNYIQNLKVNESNEMYYTDNHFYNNEFYKSRIHKINDSVSKTVGELFYYHHFLFKHLEKFSSFPIFNLDKEGLVDCFSKNHDLDIYF
jgi:hypothetical protein